MDIFFEKGIAKEYAIFSKLSLSKELFSSLKMLFVSLDPLLILKYSIEESKDIDEFNFGLSQILRFIDNA